MERRPIGSSFLVLVACAACAAPPPSTAPAAGRASASPAASAVSSPTAAASSSSSSSSGSSSASSTSSTSSTSSADAPTAAEDLDARVSAVLRDVRARHDVPGLVAAVVRDGAVVARGADGVRRRGGSTAITVDDPMHLGSCTKAMTATLCALLVEEGRLAFETRVLDVFPELAGTADAGWSDVRLADLLTNHGGAPADLDADGLWMRLCLSRAAPREQRLELVRGVLARPPQVPPRTRFVYSNAGFAIAGAMAERVTDTPYEELLAARVFAPLGMEHAGFGPPGTRGVDDAPRGHTAKGKPVEVGPNADNPAAIAPAGRVHAPIGDWARFVAFHARGERASAADAPTPLLPPEVVRRLHEPVREEPVREEPSADDAARAPDYAMGWVVTTREWGGRVLTHSGSNTFWFCVTWIAPDDGWAVLVACNQGGDTAARACDAAAGALIGAFRRPTASSAEGGAR